MRRISNRPMHPVENGSHLRARVGTHEGDANLEKCKAKEHRAQDWVPVNLVRRLERVFLLVNDDENCPHDRENCGGEHAEEMELKNDEKFLKD